MIDPKKVLWQLRIALRHFDKRKIAVPQKYLSPQGPLLFNEFSCSNILHVWEEDCEWRIQIKGCTYCMDQVYFHRKDNKILEDLAKTRPRFWW